jgi:hypothetical protein
VSIALTGAMHKALSFVHEIKTVITTEKTNMTDTMQPHWKHAGGKCWQHGWDMGAVVMKDCCFEPIMSDLMHKGKSFVHGTND